MAVEIQTEQPGVPEPDAAPAVAPAPPAPPAAEAEGPSPLDRLASFRFAYAAIFLFLVAYVFTVESLEYVLQQRFQTAVTEAAAVDPREGPVAEQVLERVSALLRSSAWIRLGDVRVRPIVLAADGHTLLYAPGLRPPPGPESATAEAALLPAIVSVDVSIPHNTLLANGVLVGYAALLVASLVGHTRRLARREQARLDATLAVRDALAARSADIQTELAGVRARLAEVEPEKEIYVEEIGALEQEGARLRARLAEVEAREAELRRGTQQATELDEERRALEELLQDATQEMAAKDAEIAELRSQAERGPRRKEGRGGKESELWERRLRTLYKNLEVDDRAISDLVALGDESLKLRAEEALKRLSDEPENAGVRRKVGGLATPLAIFELGFAGKGRIYYCKGRTRRFRLLAIGAKNSQKTDLEYLDRLSPDS